MDFKEHLQYFLDNKFIVILAEKPVVTNEFEQKVKELLANEKLTIRKTKQDKGITIVAKDYTAQEKKDIWNEFIKLTEIPHRVQTNTSMYTVRQYSISAVNKLIKILQEQGNDLSFIEATKMYYKSVSYPILLSRYLNEDYWVHELEEYKKNKTKHLQQGTNKFED